MKWLIVLGTALVLGLGGVVVLHESGRSPVQFASSDEKIATISTGDEVDLEAHLRPGTWTVVEFTADW